MRKRGFHHDRSIGSKPLWKGAGGRDSWHVGAGGKQAQEGYSAGSRAAKMKERLSKY